MRLHSFAILILTSLACGQQGDPKAARETEGPVVLRNGLNEIALLGDTTPGQVFVTWRGNFNAHGFSVVSFAVRNRSDLGDSSTWQAVPFFGGPNDSDTGREVYRTSEGADCTLGDIRVVRHSNGPIEVVLATRQLGASFTDSAAVRFDYYRIAHNVDGNVGLPPTYFQFVRSVPARRAYCDVNRAFADELQMGSAGLGHGEGGR